MDLQIRHGASIAAEEQQAADDPSLRFSSGGLGRQLGLTADELRVGLSVARNHLSRGALAEAMGIYVALVLCDPFDADYQVGLANCASLAGEHHVALQAASAVVALSPADPRGYLLSARSCLAIGSFEEAIEDLAEARRLAVAGSNDAIAQEAAMLLEAVSQAAAS